MKLFVFALIASVMGACASNVPDWSEPEEHEVEALEQELSSCLGRPANRKLLSPQCPTCPIIWVYPVYSQVAYAQVQRAAKFWNDSLGWNAIGVDDMQPPYRTDDNVPTYGVIFHRFDTNLPEMTAGRFDVDFYGCSRDRIATTTGSGLTSAFVEQIIKHEMGHALLYQTGWGDAPGGHSSVFGSIMYPAYAKNYIAVQNIDHSAIAMLNLMRAMVLSGQMSLPCALRGEEC